MNEKTYLSSGKEDGFHFYISIDDKFIYNENVRKLIFLIQSKIRNVQWNDNQKIIIKDAAKRRTKTLFALPAKYRN
jgi:hypothetical protein